MTSGNLLNLNLTQKIGGFNEQLFIDSVDHDYGLRANFSGFYVLQMNNCFLQHTIGKTYSGSAFFTSKQKIFSIHNPKRLYFIVRNGFYIARKYKKQFPKYTREIKSYINKKISYYIKYAPQKRIYIKYILKGIIDYKTNRFGNRVNI